MTCFLPTREIPISVGGPRHKFQNVPKYQCTDPVTHRKRHLRAGKVRSWLPNESSACLKCSRRTSPNLSRHRFVFRRFVLRYNGIPPKDTRNLCTFEIIIFRKINNRGIGRAIINSSISIYIFFGKNNSSLAILIKNVIDGIKKNNNVESN